MRTRERAAVRHRIDGVEDQIGQRIANLAFVSEDGRERRQLGAHGDHDAALLRQVAPARARQIDHLLDDGFRSICVSADWPSCGR